MLTGAPPADRATLSPSPRRRVWPWAAGSILVTLAIIAATLVGHRLAAQHRLASEVAPASALPPLAVQAIARAPGQITQMTLDKGAHTLVAEVVACVQPTSATPTTQYVGCGSASATSVSGVAFFDSASGALRKEYLSPSSAPQQAIALTDSGRGVTYLLADSGVTTYTDATGQQSGRYESAQVASAQAAALDAPLGLIYTLDSAGHLTAMNAGDGQVVATATVPLNAQLPPTELPQLVIDPSAGRVYIFARDHNQPEPLYIFDSAHLTLLGSWQVPQALLLGPLDSTTHTLYFSGDGDSAWRLDLSTLASGVAGQTVTPARDTALDGMIRFGFDHVTGAALLDSNAGLVLMATGATRPSAGLPLVRPPTTYYDDVSPWLLPVDSAAGLAYVAGDDNTILIVSLAQLTSHAAPNALTAEVIARAGMAALLPDTNQNPPFLSAQTFPLGAGQVARQYFIHYSDLGWQGPYSGTASLGAVKAGATAGDYTMTFSVAWNQLFLRQHSWTVEVTPDGRTHLLADSGDAIP
jgi:hypothetical protein